MPANFSKHKENTMFAKKYSSLAHSWPRFIKENAAKTSIERIFLYRRFV
jgi:CRISPR/Cas system CMR-associated protein Cmr5 small subunit